MRKTKPIESLLPTIEIEDEKGVGYMVLCWEGGRYDLDEFIYEPGVVYALTERQTEKETFILVVGYEFLPIDQMRRAIAQDNLQVELVIRTVTEQGADLVASSRLTRYPFPACLDHDLSPDRFLVEALEEGCGSFEVIQLGSQQPFRLLKLADMVPFEFLDFMKFPIGIEIATGPQGPDFEHRLSSV
jgi:hypothetical protein